MEKSLILKGMENIEKETCVQFVPWTHQQDYIDIQPKSGWEALPGKFIQVDSMMWLALFENVTPVVAMFFCVDEMWNAKLSSSGL